jgi:hypothetical protein
MSIWMDYLYGQNATLLNNPPRASGVTVRLSALDPNGNIVDLGSVTIDSGGLCKKLWTPTTAGEYTIYATFDGSNSYWGSYAETGLGVSAASSATSSTAENAQTAPDNIPYVIGAAIAIIIAVAVATVLILRKRP